MNNRHGFTPLRIESAAIRRRPHQRRAAVIVQVAILSTTLIGMAALTIDLGMLYVARTELQVSADASALAATWELLDEDRLKGSPYLENEMSLARYQAAQFASLNSVLGASPAIDFADVTFGYLEDPTNLSQALAIGNSALFNSTQVVVRRDALQNGQIELSFANIFGRYWSDLAAFSTATFKDGVVGYKVTPNTGNAALMPLSLYTGAWDALAGQNPGGGHGYTLADSYSYDEASETVSPGSDGIYELNMYPGSGAGQLPPGNFGTVDIGSSNNSTADLVRQILYGVNEADLAYHGGELRLDSNGEIQLNGDTGLSAGMKAALTSVTGQPRAIPLFNAVAGNGNNANYTVTGFGGIRIMYVQMTGAMNNKAVLVQPAFVVDDAVITGPGSGSSYYVYAPVVLSR